MPEDALFVPRLSRRAALVTAASAAVLGTPSRAGTMLLPPLKWSPTARQALEWLIEAHGTGSEGYDPSRRPYAVFDWDNTCIFGDCEETLLGYVARHFLCALEPDSFAHAIAADVPTGPLPSNFQNLQSAPVRFDMLCADLAEDYRNLKGRAEAPAVDDPVLISLSSKLLFAYQAIDAISSKLSCLWIIRLFSGRTEAELQALAAASNEFALSEQIGQMQWTTPASRPGHAGCVSCKVRQGLRLTPEMASLQAALQASGIDVFICSASLEEIVAVFATRPAYGYDLKREHVLGIRMQWPDGRLGIDAAANWPLTYHEGKVAAIRQTVADQRGHGPILVCGDSDGDTAMLTSFPDMALGLIVNRCLGGEIGALSRRAAAEMRRMRPRLVLQGRDENTGEWRPAADTVIYGRTAPALLSGG